MSHGSSPGLEVMTTGFWTGHDEGVPTTQQERGSLTARVLTRAVPSEGGRLVPLSCIVARRFRIRKKSGTLVCR